MRPLRRSRASSLWEGANPLSQSLTALPAPPKGGAFGAPGNFLIAPNTLAIGLTACALSVIAARCQIPPFVTCGDIFPRSGGSLSSKGEARALPETSSL